MTAAQAKRIADLEADLALTIERGRETFLRAEKLEAEVERLRHLGGAPPGVSPSPPFPGYTHCKSCTCFEGGGRESMTPGGGTSPSGVSPSPPRCPRCDEELMPGENWKDAHKAELAAEPAAHDRFDGMGYCRCGAWGTFIAHHEAAANPAAHLCPHGKSWSECGVNHAPF